jgi:hypothetical protein
MVTVKEELPSLDRNDFDAVNKLIDRIIKDIWKTSKQEINDKWRDELKMAMVKDYMFDLINPDLLDFDK